MEDFYGNTGAFRCLVEGGGDVAFVKHTTVMENCDGKRKEIWARNQLTADYQLLCRDGTRKKATEYRWVVAERSMLTILTVGTATWARSRPTPWSPTPTSLRRILTLLSISSNTPSSSTARR